MRSVSRRLSLWSKQGNGASRRACDRDGHGVARCDHSGMGMLGWLLVIWLLPFVGPLLYLLFGQRHSHVYFGQPSYATPNPYEQNLYQQQRQNY